MNTLSVGESFSFAWHIFKKRPLVFIGALAVALLVSGIVQTLLGIDESQSISPTAVAFSLVSAAVGILVEIGLVTFALRAHDTVEMVGIKDLWNPNPFVRYLLGQILVGVTVLVGIVLLIIPGIIAALGLIFTSYLIIDKGLGPIDAYRESWRMTKGHKGQLLLLILAIFGLNLLGLFALVVGLLVTVPVSMLVVAHAYRKLAGQGASAQAA